MWKGEPFLVIQAQELFRICFVPGISFWFSWELQIKYRFMSSGICYLSEFRRERWWRVNDFLERKHREVNRVGVAYNARNELSGRLH